MIKFEKVSIKEFTKSCKKIFKNITAFEIAEAYEKITLPKRGSAKAAGYDIYTPFSFVVKRKPVIIPLGIRVIMPDDVGLFILPRSGNGFKTGTRLANTIGLIDADYCETDNEGHIMAKITKGFSPFAAKAGDRILQCVFLKYYTVDDDKTNTKRKGGLGSSGK